MVADAGGDAPVTGGAESSPPRPDAHLPVTPGWSCGSCGDDWPCATTRSRLLREYRVDRASLSVYLGACLAAASADLPSAPGASLRERFIGWVPRRPLTS